MTYFFRYLIQTNIFGIVEFTKNEQPNLAGKQQTHTCFIFSVFKTTYKTKLLGGLESFLIFPYIGNSNSN